jgi:hypothetical protein
LFERLKLKVAISFLLNNLFSSIFGFAAIEVSLFLITCAVSWRLKGCFQLKCHYQVINFVKEEERFRRIDSKRGYTPGFV